ncbi:hypothetical protein CBR_g46850 [Chara braunii]|uniref:F-box domain-containing protein n=1 Tax=Chara braunii TaxID=69332 RepID=A0A388M135_CHABU|nr:hypothetical protein CBR_g46850 [Chara braunii]|eukprot:GBG88284.1 hypothetical protein CBR_g46850 [Chara braunii]
MEKGEKTTFNDNADADPDPDLDRMAGVDEDCSDDELARALEDDLLTVEDDEEEGGEEEEEGGEEEEEGEEGGEEEEEGGEEEEEGEEGEEGEEREEGEDGGEEEEIGMTVRKDENGQVASVGRYMGLKEEGVGKGVKRKEREEEDGQESKEMEKKRDLKEEMSVEAGKTKSLPVPLPTSSCLTVAGCKKRMRTCHAIDTSGRRPKRRHSQGEGEDEDRRRRAMDIGNRNDDWVSIMITEEVAGKAGVRRGRVEVETDGEDKREGNKTAKPRVQSDGEAASSVVIIQEEDGGDGGTGIEKLPRELFLHVLKFLSPEDLSVCSAVCRFLNLAASEESLWRRLFCMRWGPPTATERKQAQRFAWGARSAGSGGDHYGRRGWGALPTHPSLMTDTEQQRRQAQCLSAARVGAWKSLYFERDRSDMQDFLRNSPLEFREYYVQMQAAKRGQAPAWDQLRNGAPDEAELLAMVDSSVADHITAWRKMHSFDEESLLGAADHVCSGKTCSYHQIGDVFLCEKTGKAHVCDDTCREQILDPSCQLLVCAVSGRCFDRWLTPEEEEDETTEPGRRQLDQATNQDEQEIYTGSGRLARAYFLGYNCRDEKELDLALGEVLRST